MLAEHYPNFFTDFELSKHKLLEICQSKISVYHANAHYSYPTIRLPHYLAQSLAGLSTRIYQTVQDGALAFLVVVSSNPKAAEKHLKIQKNATKEARSLRLHTAVQWIKGKNQLAIAYIRRRSHIDVLLISLPSPP